MMGGTQTIITGTETILEGRHGVFKLGGGGGCLEGTSV